MWNFFLYFFSLALDHRQLLEAFASKSTFVVKPFVAVKNEALEIWNFPEKEFFSNFKLPRQHDRNRGVELF
jgi:hypothetical protein